MLKCAILPVGGADRAHLDSGPAGRHRTVILATGTSTVGPLLRLTHTVPIVFPIAADPVATGLVESLARPGGNATGFMSFESGTSAKWLELLKQIAPGVSAGDRRNRSASRTEGDIS